MLCSLLLQDIGSSLIKIAYYSTVSHRKILYDRSVSSDNADEGAKEDGGGGEDADGPPVVYEMSEGARIHFVKFETRHIEACLDCIRGWGIQKGHGDIKVTGGGAYKYADLVKSKLGLPIDKRDEMKCVVQASSPKKRGN